MHGVNLDLLRAVAVHHPDGRPKDPQAQHRQTLLTLARDARRLAWQDRLARLRTFIAGQAVPALRAGTDPQT